VEGLTLSNMDISHASGFWRLATDVYKGITWSDGGEPPSDSAPGAAGHVLFFDDVRDPAVEGLRARPSADGAAVLRCNDVRRALLRGILPGEGAQTLLEVSGGASSGITLSETALQGAAKPVSLLGGVDPAAVRAANP